MLEKTNRKEQCPSCKKEVAVLEKVEYVRTRPRKMGARNGPGEKISICDVCTKCGTHFTPMHIIKEALEE